MLTNPNLFPQPFVCLDAFDPDDPNAFLDIEDDATEFVVPTEPPADEPEWMLIDPWICEAVREYDAREYAW